MSADVNFTRRSFVGGVLAAGIGSLAVGLVGCAPAGEGEAANGEGAATQPQTGGVQQPSQGSAPTSAPDASKDGSTVFAVRGTDGTDDGVQRLLALMEDNGLAFYRTAEAPDGLIAADDVVVLKINCQWAQRGGTNTNLLEAIARAIAAHPEGFVGEVVVADNGQAQYGSAGKGGSLDWDETNAADRQLSALDVVGALKGQMRISGSLWDDFTMQQVGEFSVGDTADGMVIEDTARATGIVISYPKFTTQYGTQVSFKEGIWLAAQGSYAADRLKVINLPVLKVHGLYQVTGAVKSYMGTTASKLTGQASHNSVGKGGMGTQLAATRMPALNIMDMIWVGVSRGPGITYNNAAEVGMLAASTDPVALDWWCTRSVLMPLLESSGTDTSSVDPDTTHQGTFGSWLALTADELHTAGLPANRGDAVTAIEA